MATLGAATDDVALECPREPGHGDLATAVALRLAKPLKRPPRRIAEAIVATLDVGEDLVSRVEVAGPGFINFWLTETTTTGVARTVLDRGDTYGRSHAGADRRVNVELVFASLTEPLNVGHGRGAALGDAMANLLDATGHVVRRECYVNDAAAQIDCDLADFGVFVDVVSREARSTGREHIARNWDALRRRDVVCEHDDTLWLRTFGDDDARVRLVRARRNAEEVRFSKRSDEFVTLRGLFAQTGVDAARYFLLMCRGDARLVFDVDLAMKQSEENPVYHVQYAHARMAGVFHNAGIDPTAMSAGVALDGLDESDEVDLAKGLARYPAVVEHAAATLEPHRIIAYLERLARLANGWYHRHRAIGAGGEQELARLVLARATQIVLANGLTLLGITAPERM